MVVLGVCTAVVILYRLEKEKEGDPGQVANSLVLLGYGLI